MQPPCPNCRQPMAAADLHRLFVCAPCRQIIQYFGAPAAPSSPVQPCGLSAVESVRPLPQSLRARMAAANPLPGDVAIPPARQGLRRSA